MFRMLFDISENSRIVGLLKCSKYCGQFATFDKYLDVLILSELTF